MLNETKKNDKSEARSGIISIEINGLASMGDLEDMITTQVRKISDEAIADYIATCSRYVLYQSYWRLDGRHDLLDRDDLIPLFVQYAMPPARRRRLKKQIQERIFEIERFESIEGEPDF